MEGPSDGSVVRSSRRKMTCERAPHTEANRSKNYVIPFLQPNNKWSRSVPPTKQLYKNRSIPKNKNGTAPSYLALQPNAPFLSLDACVTVSIDYSTFLALIRIDDEWRLHLAWGSLTYLWHVPACKLATFCGWDISLNTRYAHEAYAVPFSHDRK